MIYHLFRHKFEQKREAAAIVMKLHVLENMQELQLRAKYGHLLCSTENLD